MSKIMYGVKITCFDYFFSNERSFSCNVQTKHSVNTFNGTFSFNRSLMVGAIYTMLHDYKTPQWMRDSKLQTTRIESNDNTEFSLVMYKMVDGDEDNPEPREERIVIMTIKIVTFNSKFLENEL